MRIGVFFVFLFLVSGATARSDDDPEDDGSFLVFEAFIADVIEAIQEHNKTFLINSIADDFILFYCPIIYTKERFIKQLLLKKETVNIHLTHSKYDGAGAWINTDWEGFNDPNNVTFVLGGYGEHPNRNWFFLAGAAEHSCPDWKSSTPNPLF